MSAAAETKTMKIVPRVIGWAAVVVVLALVAMSYLNPHLMLDLADRLWSCF